jgi:hypothetical protein
VAVATIGGAGAQVVSDLGWRRARILRSFSSPEALLARNSLTLRMVAAKNRKDTRKLWGATPLIRRRSGSSAASSAPFLTKPFISSFELRRVA